MSNSPFRTVHVTFRGGLALSLGVALASCAAMLAPGCSSTPAPSTEDAAVVPVEASTDAAVDSGEATCNGRGDVPADTSARGPWPVGVRTVTVGGLTHEVWYPARRGSEAGKVKKVYDLRYAIPADARPKITDEKAPRQPCDCFDELPVDAERGSYPVVVFFHGTAGFRTQSLSQMTHWASRGFVVVSTDHPKLWLADALNLDISQNVDQPGNTSRLLDALAANDPALAFLEGKADLSRLGAAGHSAGGGAVARFTRPNLRVRIPMAAGGVTASADLRDTLVLGADEDTVVPPARQRDGYASSPKPKRLAMLAKAGHLAFSDICEAAKDQGGLFNVAKEAGIFVPDLLVRLGSDGCKPEQLAPEKAHEAVNALTSAVLEEGLACGKPEAYEAAKAKLGATLSETLAER